MKLKRPEDCSVGPGCAQASPIDPIENYATLSARPLIDSQAVTSTGPHQIKRPGESTTAVGIGGFCPVMRKIGMPSYDPSDTVRECVSCKLCYPANMQFCRDCLVELTSVELIPYVVN